MKYLSLFSGIGGFELGIQKAYENRNTNVQKVGGWQETKEGELQEDGERLHSIPSKATLHIRNGNNELPDRSVDEGQPTCIGYSEIDKYAIQIYQKQFPQHKNYGDITKINVQELPDFDLLVGGFPCQAFSIAGKRKGFDDTRGTLFFDIARILKEKRPRNFILENVKGLLSHDNGRTFKTIISTLAELGYCVEWQVLNAKNFGVPQNRERVFIVGHLGGIPERKVFPIGGTNTETYKTQKLPEPISNTLRTNYSNGKSNETYIRQLNNPKHSNDRIYGTDGISPTLNTAQGGNRQPFIPENARIRRLTPLECERLMGYPDGWTKDLSDTQRYKTLGNGIVSNVVQHIIERMYR